MDCFFHSNVPSIARCTACAQPICATCRDDMGSCPSCRLAAKIDAAAAPRPELGGRVPPRGHAPPPPPPPFPPRAQPQATVSTVGDPTEMRALVALGYPLWPLALLGLFDRKKSAYLKRQAYQALGFNLGFAGFFGILKVVADINIPFLDASAALMLPLLVPLFLVASAYYGIKVWHGDDVRIPIVSDWLDDRLPAS